jgi:hypothetical protein
VDLILRQGGYDDRENVSSLYHRGRQATRRDLCQMGGGLGQARNKDGLMLRFAITKRENDIFLLKDIMEELLEVIEKVEKRKNWVGGRR